MLHSYPELAFFDKPEDINEKVNEDQLANDKNFQIGKCQLKVLSLKNRPKNLTISTYQTTQSTSTSPYQLPQSINTLSNSVDDSNIEDLCATDTLPHKISPIQPLGDMKRKISHGHSDVHIPSMDIRDSEASLQQTTRVLNLQLGFRPGGLLQEAKLMDGVPPITDRITFNIPVDKLRVHS